MFWSREEKEKKKLAKLKRQEAYDRVYKLHQEAEFICYIDEICEEEYQGELCVKLVGNIAMGEGTVQEQYSLYSCEGRWKGTVDIEEFYVGADKVNQLDGSDKQVAIYPKQRELAFKAGDILCKLRRKMDATDYQ